MAKKIKKICIVWYWGRAKEIFPQWRDGLRAAMEILEKKYDVDWILGEIEPEDKYDFILVWSDDEPALLQKDYKCPMGLVYGSTFVPDVSKLRKLKVVYVENTITYELMRRDTIRAIKAFGTDTGFFSPDKTKKDIKYFFPGTFSPWKCQQDISGLGKHLTCVGEVQHDGQKQLQACKNTGVNIIPKNVSAKEIRDLYRRAEKVIIPADYGSERTVLEAMSMDILPTILSEKNDRAKTYLKEFKDSGMDSPREFIKKFYSAQHYADQLIRGIEE